MKSPFSSFYFSREGDPLNQKKRGEEENQKNEIFSLSGFSE